MCTFIWPVLSGGLDKPRCAPRPDGNFFHTRLVGYDSSVSMRANQICKNSQIERPGGIVINKYHRTLYILEFKRSSRRNKDLLRVKEDDVNEQHRSIIVFKNLYFTI